MFQVGSVITTLEEFENVALFLRLGLLSTLIRDENAALFLRLGLPSTLIRHENEALFLRLGLPSTLIRHKNTAFRNTPQSEAIKKRRLFVLCGQKTFSKKNFSGTMTSRILCLSFVQAQMQNNR